MAESNYQNTSASGFNFTTAGTQPSEKGVAPAQRNTLRLWDQKGDPTNIGRGEITIYDFSQQGYNHPEGPFSQNSNGFAWSSLVTNRTNEMVPARATTGSFAFTPTGNFVGFHSAAAFGTLIFGTGSGSGAALGKQTSSTNPLPTAITYNHN